MAQRCEVHLCSYRKTQTRPNKSQDKASSISLECSCRALSVNFLSLMVYTTIIYKMMGGWSTYNYWYKSRSYIKVKQMMKQVNYVSDRRIKRLSVYEYELNVESTPLQNWFHTFSERKIESRTT